MKHPQRIQEPTPAGSPLERGGPRWWCSRGLMGLVLAMVTLAVYWIAGRNEFVNYDDPDYVTSNPHVLTGLTWENLRWAFTTGHASNWHPLTWLSHMLDCQVFGAHAAAHHLVNVAFHSANAVLLFLVLRRMTGAHWRSALVAALFALHPLHVESVAWISERKDVLSTFFLLLALAAYARSVARLADRPPPPGLPQAKPRGQGASPRVADFIDYALRFLHPGPGLVCLGWFALGLMSKPMLVTVPFLLLLLDYWPLGRFGVETGEAERRRFWLLLVEKTPFFALSLLSSVVTYLVQRKGGAVSTSLTVGERLGNALVSYARYLGKMWWPENLSVLYPHPGHWPLWQVGLAGALLAGLSAGAIVLRRNRPYPAVGWFWFVGMLIPVIGLVQVGIQSMADRYTYVPIIGLFIIVAWGVADLVPQRPWRPFVLAAGAATVLVLCAGLTFRQIQFWRTSETLFRRATQVSSKNYLAYNNLGFYLAAHGGEEEAMEDYRKALEINPLYEDALNNLGYALAGRKHPAEAIPLYEAALRIRPNHVEVHNNLGNALADVGRIPEAIAHYRFVLQENPEHADAHNNLGIALAMQGKLDEALEHFRAAIRFKPDYASAHSNLGNGLAAQHKFDEAITEYRESLRLNPKDAQAHNNLGNVFAEENRLEEAIQQYSEAIRLNADNPEAQLNLGLAYARLGKPAEAIAHCREALRLKPDYAAARTQLEKLLRPSGNAATASP